MPKKKREYSIDFLKFVSTILIILHHYQQIYVGDYTIIKFYDGKFYFGHLVELFFIISGFFALNMISKAELQEEDFETFFGKRLKRLLPLMIITAVADQVMRLIYQILVGKPLGVGLTMWGTVLAALGLQSGGAFKSQGINNPTWYVCCLLICYAVLYFLTWLSKKISVKRQWLYSGMILIGSAALSYGLKYPFLTKESARGYVAFFVGICLAMLMKKYEIHKNKKIVLSCVIFLMFFLAIFSFAHEIVANDIRFILVFMVWPSLFIMFRSPFAQKVFCWGFWGVLGAISFNAYMWHSNVNKIYSILRDWKGFDGLYSREAMILNLILCFIVGTVSYLFLEKPMNAYLEKRKSKDSINSHI